MNLFLSHSHQNLNLVEEDMQWLSSRGYEILVDQQIEPGTDWREKIANDLMRSDLVIFFSSKYSNSSRHCLAEVGFALDLEKPVLVVKLDDDELSPGLRMYLNNLQAIHRYAREDNYQSSLLLAIRALTRESELKRKDRELKIHFVVAEDGSKNGEVGNLFQALMNYLCITTDEISLTAENEATDVLKINVFALPETYDVQMSFKSPDDGLPKIHSFQGVLVSSLITEFYKAFSEHYRDLEKIDVEPLRDNISEADTNLLPAMTHFLVGLTYHRQNNFIESVRALEQAVTADPNFSIALRSLAVDLLNTGWHHRSMDLYDKLLKMLDRQSDNQKAVSQAWYHTHTGSYHKAVKAWEAYSPGTNIDRSVALANLAIVRLYSRDTKSALITAESSVSAKDDIFTRSNLAIFLMYAGDFERCEEKVNSIGINGSIFQLSACMALCQLAMGRPNEARRVYDLLLLGNQYQHAIGTLGLADLYACTNDYELARDTLVLGWNGERPFAMKMAVYAGLYSAMNKDAVLPEITAQLLEPEERQRLPKEDLYVLCRALAIAGEEQKLTEAAKSLEKSFDSDARLLAKLLKAELWISVGELNEAVDLLDECNATLDTWMGHFLSAQAYLHGGAKSRSLLELDVCLSRPGEALALMFDEIPTAHLYELAVKQRELAVSAL